MKRRGRGKRSSKAQERARKLAAQRAAETRAKNRRARERAEKKRARERSLAAKRGHETRRARERAEKTRRAERSDEKRKERAFYKKMRRHLEKMKLEAEMGHRTHGPNGWVPWVPYYEIKQQAGHELPEHRYQAILQALQDDLELAELGWDIVY